MATIMIVLKWWCAPSMCRSSVSSNRWCTTVDNRNESHPGLLGGCLFGDQAGKREVPHLCIWGSSCCSRDRGAESVECRCTDSQGSLRMFAYHLCEKCAGQRTAGAFEAHNLSV